MGVNDGAKWVGGLLTLASVLLVASLFVGDRRLEPPFEEAELGVVTVPSGGAMPIGTMFFAADGSGSFEIYARPPGAADVVALTDDPTTDSWRPRLSPDRRTILFYRSPAGLLDTDLRQVSLWMMAADGGDPVEILPPRSHGWISHGGAEWSPLGDGLVMMGERPNGIHIWVTSIDGRRARNLVNDGGDSTDPSWSPDGKRVVFTGCVAVGCATHEREVFVVPATGGERIRITNDDLMDAQPRFSPSGRQIVFRSRRAVPAASGQALAWDLRVVATDRTMPPRSLIGDEAAGFSGGAVWVDDQTLLFHRFDADGTNAGIFRVRVFDAAIEEVLDGPADELFPAL